MNSIDLVPPLSEGGHDATQDAMCIMEAVAFVAGEPWSDHPQCACPVIGAFLRTWNDDLPDDERDTLLRPLIPRLINTKGDAELERRRAMMAADWLIRTHTPAWLRLAGLTVHADALATLPGITDMAQYPPLMPVLNAAKADASAAWDAAGDAVWDAAWDALKATRLQLQQSALRSGQLHDQCWIAGMTQDDLIAWVRASATDQPPGLYVTRKPGVKPRDGKPGDAVCLICDGEYWYCLVNGEQQAGSGVADPIEIPFVLWNGPFWPATEAEYLATMSAAKEAAIEEGKP